MEVYADMLNLAYWSGVSHGVLVMVGVLVIILVLKSLK